VPQGAATAPSQGVCMCVCVWYVWWDWQWCAGAIGLCASAATPPTPAATRTHRACTPRTRRTGARLNALARIHRPVRRVWRLFHHSVSGGARWRVCARVCCASCVVCRVSCVVCHVCV
jgi:hypothetical protein